MKRETSTDGIALSGSGEPGSARPRESRRSMLDGNRLQRISGALLEEVWLPMSFRCLVAEELLLSDTVDTLLTQKAQAVLEAARGYGLDAEQSAVFAETEGLFRELAG